MTPFRLLAVAFAFLFSAVVFAQGPPAPLPPEVGNAVLLATHSIQVDRNVRVISGDLVVNDAGAPPYLGEAQLSVDQGVNTPGGFALKGNSVDIDGGALIGGDVVYNTISNNGTVLGNLHSPLALPVISQLPTLGNATAGTTAINVANGQTQVVGTGAYGDLVVGRDATLHLPGGPYVFASVSVNRGATIVWDGPGEMDVIGNFTLGADVTISAAPGVTTKHKMILVHGPSLSAGTNNNLSATFFAPNGTIDVGNGSKLLGSLVGRDIRVGRDSTLELRSGFRNLPPIAISQSVIVGSSPLLITLTGIDPDNDPLTFSIGPPPSFGTLSPLTPNGPNSATVVYTPNEPSPDDAFGFRVTDSEGFDAMAFVIINEGVPPSPPTTIEARDATVDVLNSRPANVVLPAVAPPGVAVTVSIVSGSGPTHGTLGPLHQPTLMPRTPGSVVYVAQSGYVGPDAFSYEACGTVAGNPVCDQGTITLNVVAPFVEPPNVAPDIFLSAPSNTTTAISLFPNNTLGPQAMKFRIKTEAATLVPVTVAGNVADANGDGLGDNHTQLPGPVPVLMSAGVGQTGGPGSNGTVRMHFEWDITSIASSVSQLASANVILRTNRGTTDSLDTFFYLVGDNGDGQLSDSDYERPAEPLRFLVMKVPPTQPIGADGTFTFDVLQPLKDAAAAGFTHLSLQARVNETNPTPGRGLQVYTSATSSGPNAPQLALATIIAPFRTYRITSLPANATLKDSSGTTITTTPYTLPNAFVFFRSLSGFTGQSSFAYEVTQDATINTGTVTVNVFAGDCAADPAFCDNGR